MKFSIKDFLSKREQLLKITFTEEILNEKLHCFVLCEGSDVGEICRILNIALHSYPFDYDFIVFFLSTLTAVN